MTTRLTHLPLVLLALILAPPSTMAQASLNPQEQQIAGLMANASGQKRASVTVDPILSSVARARAMDLAKRRYFAHVNPDGRGANSLVQQAGYPLPSHYDQSPSGNNIESLAAGDSTAQGAWSTWMGSSPHKTHLMGESAFYAGQTSIGVGYYFDPASEYNHYWVVLSAPPSGPGLAVTSPKVNESLPVPAATVSGTTGGVPTAARVVYRLENANGAGAFLTASGVSTWNGAVSGLILGDNTLRVRSLGASGAVLKEVTRVFRHTSPGPMLVVSVEGSGKISPGFLGSTERKAGNTYTVSALKAKKGWVFERWAGSVQSSSSTISFVMSSGMSLTAKFRPLP